MENGTLKFVICFHFHFKAFGDYIMLHISSTGVRTRGAGGGAIAPPPSHKIGGAEPL